MSGAILAPTKFTVTMRNTVISEVDGGRITHEHVAVDHVPADQLDAYVTDARTRWASVETAPEGD